MRIKVEGGNLCLSIFDLIDELSLEEKRGLIDTLSCSEEILMDVTAQLLDGCTNAGSYGATRNGDAEPSTALGKARREIARRASKVAQKEIDDLVRSLKWAKACEDNYSAWGFRLYHKYPGAEMCPHVKYDDTVAYEVVKK